MINSRTPVRALTYRPEIDGLRALAILSVIAYHAGVKLAGGGYVGVDIFFVISGYLIGFIVYDEVRRGKFTFSGFYARRARRILPALLALVSVLYAAGAFLLSPAELAAFARNALSALAGLSNIKFLLHTNYFATSAELNPMLMTWSLGVEEQFYLLFPCLILLMRRAKVTTILITLLGLALLSFGLSVWALRLYPAGVFFLLPFRAWELAIGAILAIAHAEGMLRRLPQALLALAGTAMIACAIFGFTPHTPFPGWAALLPTCGAAALIAVTRPTLAGWLANPVFVFIGRISYSWYLWHWPLLSLAHIAAPAGLTPAGTAGIVGLSLMLAILSWRFVETPFRRTRRPPARLLPRYAMALVLVALPGVAITLLHGVQQRFKSPVMLLDKLAHQGQDDPCLAGYGDTGLPDASACSSGATGSPHAILIGDSHAAALAPALRQMAEHEGLGFRQLTKSSCPPLQGVTKWMHNHPAHGRECTAFNQAALAAILQDTQARVVILSASWANPFSEADDGVAYAHDGDDAPSPRENAANLQAGLTAITGSLRAAGKHVVVIGDTPLFDFDPVRLRLTQLIPLRRYLAAPIAIDPEVMPGLVSNAHVTNEDTPSGGIVAKAGTGARYVDGFSPLCGEGGCRFADGNTLFYYDEQHLSAAGAAQLLEGLSLLR